VWTLRNANATRQYPYLNMGRVYAGRDGEGDSARALRCFLCALHHAPRDETLLVVVQRFWLAAVRGETDKLEL
jgi:hypothetical protein